MADRKYLYTERAHYMCPNMHFGIMVEIDATFDENRIIESIDVLKTAHSLMRSLIAEEQGSSGIYYEEHSELKILVTIKKASENWKADYETVSSAGWNVQNEALLKIFGYEKRNGHCITNLGRIESSVIREGVFIPPASPANREAWGVLTINKKMRICSIHSM